MSGAKERIRRAVSKLLVLSGVTAVGRRLPSREGAIILMGHRVAADDEGYLAGVPPDHFASQVAYLARHYEIISLGTLVRCFEERRAVPSRSVVLTFDDGFRDNLEHALPVLEKHRAPATVFVVTGSVSSGDLPWSQRLGVVFQRTRAAVLSAAHAGREMDLSTPPARRRAYDAAKARIRELSRLERERAIDGIALDLGVEPPRDRMLSWAHVRDLSQRGIEIGAHTFSHPLLACIPPAEARWEMERSKEDLKRELGLESMSFAFPGGSWTPSLVGMAREIGFRSVFQSSPRRRLNSPATTHQFALSRIGLLDAPAYVLEAELEGPFHSLRKLYRRR